MSDGGEGDHPDIENSALGVEKRISSAVQGGEFDVVA
jgi:hypothetical protein